MGDKSQSVKDDIGDVLNKLELLSVGAKEGSLDKGYPTSPESGDLAHGPKYLENVPEPENAADSIASLPHVMFDLETTGLGKTCHITQIAAVGPDDTKFSQYVLPKVPIHPKASEITGITCVNGKLYHNGQILESAGIKQALNSFMSFLDERGVILVAHNAKRFDAPVLLNAADNACLKHELKQKVVGFLDTLPLFRSFCPGLGSYKLGALFGHYIGETFNAHEALADASALKQVVDKAAIPYDKRQKFVYNFEDII